MIEPESRERREGVVRMPEREHGSSGGPTPLVDFSGDAPSWQGTVEGRLSGRPIMRWSGIDAALVDSAEKLSVAAEDLVEQMHKDAARVGFVVLARDLARVRGLDELASRLARHGVALSLANGKKLEDDAWQVVKDYWVTRRDVNASFSQSRHR